MEVRLYCIRGTFIKTLTSFAVMPKPLLLLLFCMTCWETMAGAENKRKICTNPLSFVRSFVRLFVYSFVCLFIRSFVCLFVWLAGRR